MLVDWVNDGNQWYLYTMIPLLLISVACAMVYFGVDPLWGVIAVFNPLSVGCAMMILLEPLVFLGLALSMFVVYILLKFIQRIGG